jgi:NitT/TauT family transport system substrate-binding protein
LLRHAISTTRGTRRRAGLSLAMAALLAAGSLTGCSALGGTDNSSSGNASVEKATIKVAILPTIDLSPLFLAQKEGYFKAEGLTVQVVDAPSGQATLQKMISGEVDIAFATYVPFFLAKSKGVADIKLVADSVSASPNSNVIVTSPNSPVKTVKDLAGKKIGVTATGTASDTLTKAIMKANGVDYTKVQFVPTPFPAMAAALTHGDIDAAYMAEPFITQAEKSIGAAKVVDVASGPTEDFPIAGYGALAKFVSANPKTVAAFQRAMKKASDEASTDRAKVQPIIVSDAKVDADTAALVTLPNYHSTMDPSRLQRVPDQLLEFGLIPSRIDVTPMLAAQPTS